MFHWILLLLYSLPLFAQVITPGISWELRNSVQSNINYTVSDYQTVILCDSTLSYQFLTFQHIGNLTICNNVLTQLGETNIQYTNVSYTTITGNSFYDQSSIVAPSNGSCINPYRLMDYYITQNQPLLRVRDNTYYGTQVKKSGLIYLNYNQALSSEITLDTLDYGNNQLRFNDSNPYYMDPSLYLYNCPNPYPNNFNGQNTHWSFGFFNLDNIYVRNATFETKSLYSTNSSIVEKELNAETNFTFDSLIHIRLGRFGSLQMDNSSIQTTYGLPYPVRSGLLFTNGSLSDLTTPLQLDTSNPQYQYIARQILARNPLVESYVYDVQIESNPQLDEYSGVDECHNTCRRNCSGCFLTDYDQLPQEFSIYTSGACYERQQFSDLDNSTRKCPHETLFITTPFRSNLTLIFATQNFFTNKSRITGRYSEKPVFHLADSILKTDIWAYTLDSETYTYYPDDALFTGKKSIIIQPIETVDYVNGSIVPFTNGVILRELHLDNVHFKLELGGGTMGIFNLMTYQTLPPVQYNLTKLSFNDCILEGVTPTNLFQQGFGLLVTDTVELDWFSLISRIGTLEILNTQYIRLDRLSSLALFPIDNFNIQNNFFSTVQNGLFYTLDFTSIQLNNNEFNVSFLNVDKTFVSAIGTNQSTVIVTNNDFTRVPWITPDNTLQSSLFYIKDVASLTFQSTVSEAYGGIGLHYWNIGNIPCNVTYLVFIENNNPQMNGTIYDVYCSPDGIGCSKDNCYFNPSLAPPYCIVDPLYPTNATDYRIMYFHTSEEAFTRCIAGNGLIPRDIYWSNYFHLGSFNPVHYFSSEQLRCYALSGTPIIVTANGLFSVGNVTIDGLQFVNPRELTGTPTSAVDPYLLYTNALTILTNLRITNSRFFGCKPYVPLAAQPTTKAGWDELLANFTNTNSDVLPQIWAPNTAILVEMIMRGNSHYENLEFYCSRTIALSETKLLTANETTVARNLTGQNNWSAFLYLLNQNTVYESLCACNFFCGGITNSLASIYQFTFQNGKRFIFNTTESLLGPNPRNHSFVTQRLMYGNPFQSSFFLGYLASVWITGLSGNTWEQFEFRENQLIGYPIAVRLQNPSDSVLNLNNRNVLYDDARRYPRQIQYENNPSDPTGYMSGTVFDVKFGDPFLDLYQTNDNFCNQMCPPGGDQSYCTVNSALITEDTFNFRTLRAALQYCRREHIYFTNSTHYENLNYNFVYTVRDGTSITITGHNIATTIIYGNHVFNQSCTLSQLVPTNIIFQNIEFAGYGSGYSSDLITIYPQNGVCGYTKIQFIGTILTSATNNTLANLISCIGCNVGNLTLSGVTTTNGNYMNGVLLDSPIHIQVSGNSQLSIARVHALSLSNMIGFWLKDSLARCNTQNVTYNTGCIYIFGSLTPTDHRIQNMQVYANPDLPNVPNTAVTWNFNQAFTFSQIQLIVNQILQSTSTATLYGLQLISNGIESNYPCLPSTYQNLQALGNANNFQGNVKGIVLTDNGTIINTYIAQNAIHLQCFYYSLPVPEGHVVLYTFLFLAGIAIFLFYFLFTFRGLEWLFSVWEWWIEDTPTKPPPILKTKKLD